MSFPNMKPKPNVMRADLNCKDPFAQGKKWQGITQWFSQVLLESLECMCVYTHLLDNQQQIFQASYLFGACLHVLILPWVWCGRVKLKPSSRSF